MDDEIDLLRPYILFLEEKGYRTECVNNGRDAIEMCRLTAYDIVFLDEQMPGLSGLETVSQLYDLSPNIPVVMVTKSEDEGIMNRAIGKKIADYLIKPVNPNQLLLTIKKILEKRELVSETVSVNFRDEYRRLNEDIRSSDSADDWKDIYKRLIYWELELERTNSPLKDLPPLLRVEANIYFSKFVRKNYKSWVLNRANHSEPNQNSPVISPGLFETALFPLLDRGEKLFFILIDNFRLDQWEIVKDIVNVDFSSQEEIYFSILPSATQYSRNSIFSGLMPLDIVEMFPHLWVGEREDDGKNRQEEELIKLHLKRVGRENSFSYNKINSNREGERVIEHFEELRQRDLNVVVFNFIDMLSHAGTESKILRELTANDAAYRSLTRSWFLHSPFGILMNKIAAGDHKVIITSDHGSVRVKNGVKVVGDKETSSGLRYKLGKNLGYDPKGVFDITDPENFGLPSPNISTRYIFAENRDFFLYPNNFNYFFSYYENSYQHGGVSMEEMMVPCITLTSKR